MPEWVKWSATIAMLAGFAIAYLFYIATKGLPQAFATAFKPLYLLFLNKWYFDELYDWIFVRPTKWLARTLWQTGDGAIIDGLGANGIAARVLDITARAVRLQTGFVYHYAFVMLAGVTVIATIFALPPETRALLTDFVSGLFGK